MIDIKLFPRVRFMYERGDGFVFYFGKERRATYIAFHPRLHNGWKSYPKFFWNKGGWEYIQPAILIGNQKTRKSKWHMFPEILIPAKLYDIWWLRKRSHRKARKEDNELVEKESK